MSSLLADFDAIIQTLAEAYGEPVALGERSVEDFRALLVAFLAEQRGGQGGALIGPLDEAGLSSAPDALARSDPRELTDLLRDGRRAVPPGLVATLVRLASWVAGHDGMESLVGVDTSTLRDELRAIRGIGPGTADRLLLEVFRRPTFPVRRSDYRVLIRHGWIDPTASYDEAREAVEAAAPADPETLLRLVAWFGRLAVPCRVSRPRCDRCPLRPFLPESGPLEPC